MRFVALAIVVSAAAGCVQPPVQSPVASSEPNARIMASEESHAEPTVVEDDAHDATSPAPHPTDLDDDTLHAHIDDNLVNLGSLSMGKPNAGALLNGVPFPEGERWEVLDPSRAWATQETIDYLKTAIDAVHDEFGDAHKLIVGHLSREHGGRLRPHRSHQSGRDVDTSYYYRPDKAEWYRPATKGTLDLGRTWTFVRALLTQTDVEMIFIDTSVQRLLKQYALDSGEDREWIDSVFQYRGRGGHPVIRHVYGHKTHIHVRFFNPRAQQLGHRVYDELAKRKVIKPRHYTVAYIARPGDNVASLAAKAGTSERALRRLNGLDRVGRVEPGRTYFIPVRGQVARVHTVAIPPRRLPPMASGARIRGVTAAADGAM